jgi:hypothetical protein
MRSTQSPLRAPQWEGGRGNEEDEGEEGGEEEEEEEEEEEGGRYLEQCSQAVRVLGLQGGCDFGRDHLLTVEPLSSAVTLRQSRGQDAAHGGATLCLPINQSIRNTQKRTR